jgi:Uma2 family endonuclease
VKPALYARHGVPELWVVDLSGRALLRHRRPDAQAGAYLDVDEPDLRRPLAIDAVSDVSVLLATLFD